VKKFASAKPAATNIDASDSDSIFKELTAQLRTLGAPRPRMRQRRIRATRREVGRLNDVLTMAAGTTGYMQNI
jgi:uncharacterized protein with von Willebrand factor type A (vWA) domain